MSTINYTQFTFGGKDLTDEQKERVEELMTLALEAVTATEGIVFSNQTSGALVEREEFEI